MRSDRGFGIVETGFSIALIAVSALLVINLFSYMTKVSSKGGELGVSASMCDMLLSDVSSNKSSPLRKRMIENSVGGFSACGSEVLGERVYYYILEVLPLKSSEFAGSGLMKADVVVFWFAAKSPFGASDFDRDDLGKSSIEEFLSDDSVKELSRTESGFSYTRLSRLVSVPKE